MPVAPLDGVFVLEVANWIAGPCCGAMMADMGATVVKIEPPEGDSMRYVQRQPLGKNGKPQSRGECIDHAFTLDNRGKQSVTVNLSMPEGQQLVRAMAMKADVFLTNLLPARLEKFGLDYASLENENDRLVYASVSGWGLKGPDRDRLAFDMTAFFARGGVMGVLGPPDAPPVKPRSGQGDHQTGLACLASVLGALLVRNKTGKGCQCEASLIRTATWNLGEDLSAALVDRAQPKKYGIDEPVMQRCYATADARWIIIMMPFREEYYWPRFCTAIGHPEWQTDPRYDSARKRARARSVLGRTIEAIFARDTMETWLSKLDDAGCIAGPIASLPEVCEDPQLRENGAFETVRHEKFGYEFETVASPFNIHGADVRVRGIGPEVGAHTQTVLKTWLGLDLNQIEGLYQRGVVGARLRTGTSLANWSARL